MPHYDYRCGNCGKTFEVFQSITEKPLENCGDCGGPVKRLIGGGAGILFKGSGFHRTDYSRPSPSACGSGSCCSDCPAADTGKS